MDRQRAEDAYARCAPAMYRLCFAYLKNAADAQDAVQTAFLRFLQKAGPMEPEHERAWLLRTAANVCRDELRYWWKHRRQELPAELPDPGDGARGREVRDQVWALEEKYRVVLYLHYFEGYTAEETAAILGRNASTVRTQLVRARELLKLEWEETP